MTNTETPAPDVASSADSPLIYVACLAAYNNGQLHGAWIEASCGEDHI